MFTFGLRFPHGVDVSINTCLTGETQSDCKYCSENGFVNSSDQKSRERMSGCNSAGAKSAFYLEGKPQITGLPFDDFMIKNKLW